jgi:hypothetical protein
MFGKERQDRQARERELLISYKRVFGSPEGKSVLKDLMTRFHVFNEHDADPIKEGQRSAVLHIMKTIGMSIEKFDELWKENIE